MTMEILLIYIENLSEKYISIFLEFDNSSTLYKCYGNGIYKMNTFILLFFLCLFLFDI